MLIASLISSRARVTDTISVKIISAPYFLATKLEAFKYRGKQDLLLSHDLEDIVSLIDGRPEIVNDIASVSDDLKQYLAFEFSLLMNNFQFIQALPGHLNDSNQSDGRLKIVKSRIIAIMSLGE